MGRGGSIRLANVFGIRIGLDPTFFIVLALIIWILSDYFRDVMPDSTTLAAYLLATASALIFFLSIVLHELGHALVAIRNKIGISGIDLWMFGGVAKMTRDTDSPGVEFKVAIAGPIVTLLITAACVAIGILAAGWDDFLAAMRLDPDALNNGGLAMLAYLASINFIVFVFNLIPAFPLDGGRVARSIAWKILGNKGRATKFAAQMGRVFAYIMIAVGIWRFVMGDVIGGLWLAFLGFFLNQAARSAEQQSVVSSKIEGITVADVMDSDPVPIYSGTSVEEAARNYFSRYRYPWFPVVTGAQLYLGVLDRGQVDALSAPEMGVTTVDEIMTKDIEGHLRVDEDENLESLLGNQALGRIGALFAVDAAGQLRGIVTIDDIRRALHDTGLNVNND